MGYTQKDKRLEIEHGPTNATIFVDSHHTFYCTAKGKSPLSIIWQHKNNSAWSFVEETERYSIHSKRNGSTRNGSFSISRVLARDAGMYRCGVQHKSDPIFTYSTTVYLIVHARAEIVLGPISQVARWGEVVMMTCEVVALPLPERTWYQDGVQIREGKNAFIGPVLNLTAHHTCNITCQAKNGHFNGTTLVVSHASLTVVDGSCEKMNNGVCLPYLTYNSVFSRLSQPQQLTLNNQLINNLLNKFNNYSISFTTTTTLPISTLSTPFSSASSSYSLSSSPSSQLPPSFSPSCFHNLHLVLCYYANPQCTINNNHIARSSHLCRESCEAIEHVYCSPWWQNNDISSILSCQQLPSMHQSTECVHLNLFQLQNQTKACYQGNGDSYTGRVNKTSSGRVCQWWKNQQPHPHHLLPSFIPYLQHNHCRNPGAVRLRPWCFTMDVDVEWEYCGVPHCDSKAVEIKSMLAETANVIDQYDIGMALLVLACLVGFLITLVLLALAMIYLLRRRRKKRFKHTNEESIALNIPAHLSTISNINIKSDPLLLDRNSVVYVEDIANGAFGLVFKATLQQGGDSRGSSNQYVAIKMLKQDTNDVTRMEFVRQASIMSQFNHAHILKLLGVCFIGDPSWVAVEYMERGDLRSYLPKMRLHPSNTCILHQLSISRQIATALQYLEHRRFLHRDLAARNFLVSAANIPDGAPLIKLADFTFTIELQVGNGVYVGMDDEAIAVRWAAPEAIQIGFFTFASDVWSFGVVLWEIFSFSEQPYQEFKHFDEISKHVRKGGILLDPCPNHPVIYRLIKKCWAPSADDRCQSNYLLSELNLLHSQYQDNKVS